MPFEPSLIVAGGSLGLMLAAGAFEAHQLRQHHKSIPLRIHVNGTRGKSTTTRIIAAMCRAMGRTTYAKITGEQPTVIDSQGIDSRWKRVGQARIQEQARFLRLAARNNAEVAVIECMALRPNLQAISEERLVRSHIGVITNARLDHLEEMGSTRQDIAKSLAATVPWNGVVILGGAELLAAVEPLAEARNTEVRMALPGSTEAESRVHLREAVAIAQEVLSVIAGNAEQQELAVRYLHSALAAAPEYAGNTVALGNARQLVEFWSINDPDSLEAVWNEDPRLRGQTVTFLYNHRSDRPLRARVFADFFKAHADKVAGVLVTGDPGAERMFRYRLEGQVPVTRMKRRWSRADLAAQLAAAESGRSTIVVGCGNWKGVPRHDR